MRRAFSFSRPHSHPGSPPRLLTLASTSQSVAMSAGCVVAGEARSRSRSTRALTKLQNRAATSASFVPDIVLEHISAVSTDEPYETKLPITLAMLADISGFTALSDALCAHMEQGEWSKVW